MTASPATRNLDHLITSKPHRMNPFVEYFKSHGEMSDPGRFGDSLAALPGDIGDLCRIVQGLIIHPDWIPDYGISMPQERIDAEQRARTVVEVLETVQGLDGGPLANARPPGLRAVGSCRSFSLLLCSILRSRGVAARLRFGFAPYFREGRFDDHWICEYWSDAGSYWVRVDPQLDELQKEALAIGFDPLDIPIDAYLYAGEAWVMCRRGRVDPDRCGTNDRRGLGLIKGGIVRDILALNKVEIMARDYGWGILQEGYASGVERDELGYIDRLARCSANSLVHLAHSFFAEDDRIRLPEDWAATTAPKPAVH